VPRRLHSAPHRPLLPPPLPGRSDMLLAQQKVDETKAALAIAYQASTHIEDKGPQVGPRCRPRPPPPPPGSALQRNPCCPATFSNRRACLPCTALPASPSSS
jgi:hypothetical protein